MFQTSSKCLEDPELLRRSVTPWSVQRKPAVQKCPRAHIPGQIGLQATWGNSKWWRSRRKSSRACTRPRPHVARHHDRAERRRTPRQVSPHVVSLDSECYDCGVVGCHLSGVLFQGLGVNRSPQFRKPIVKSGRSIFSVWPVFSIKWGRLRQSLHNTKNSAIPNSVIETSGEIFDDGSAIELVEDLTQPTGVSLLRWRQGKVRISPEFVHQGRSYVPVTLDLSVRRALRLPSHCSAFGTTGLLFDQLVALAAEYTGLADHLLQQLVVFVFASHLPDLLPAPINLWLWSPALPNGARVLQLLGCLCRQAVMLSGVGEGDLRTLPDRLQATLLILRPASNRRTRESLAASGWPGFHMVRAGRLVEVVGAKALLTDAPLNDPTLGPMIEIPVANGRCPPLVLDKRAQEKVASEFLPKLLQYRLTRHPAKSAKTDDASPATTSQLSNGLRVCFWDEPKLGEQQIALLEAEQRENGLTDPRVILTEVLLSRCHEPQREEVQVGEVAFDVNAVIFSRGGTLQLSDRLVGSLMKSLGLRTHRLGQNGRGLGLDPSTRRAIHRLAESYHVPAAGQPFPGCAECARNEPTET